MKINLSNKCKPSRDIDVGDILVFHNPTYDDYDYFMIIETTDYVLPLRLLRLKDSTVYHKGFADLDYLVNHAKNSINNYYLKEIIPSEKLELRRIQ